jgi:hypothetical protein
MEAGHRATRGARTRAVLVLVLAAGLLLMGCGADEDRDSDACLAQAVEAAPTWPVGGPPILDTIDRCKGLSTADKTRLRAIIAAFVARISADAK